MSKNFCGAKLRKKDATCHQKPMKGSTRCRLHGGASLKGMASATYKTGKKSKYFIALASRLHQVFADLRNRNDLLKLKDEIGFIDLQIHELIKNMYDGASPAAWQDARKTFNEFQKARKARNLDQMESALTILEAIFSKNYEAENRKEVGEWLEKRRKFVESERKRMLEQQEMITAQEATLLISALTSVIRQYVTDPEARSKISEAFIRLTSSSSGGSDLIN